MWTVGNGNIGIEQWATLAQRSSYPSTEHDGPSHSVRSCFIVPDQLHTQSTMFYVVEYLARRNYYAAIVRANRVHGGKKQLVSDGVPGAPDLS